ncbi:MAG: hypothetical protein ACOYN6_00315 [Ignavibacteria bacterium]
MLKEIHLHEDTAKPENRVNLTLFHLLMIDEVNIFIKTKLSIPLNSNIYPSPNLSLEEFDVCGRPDFKVVLDSKIIGFIEVELGTENEEQITRYRKMETVKIYSIVGKKEYTKGDLSLEDIYLFIKGINNKYINSQKYYSLRLFESLIEHYIIRGNFRTFSKPVILSDKMRSSFLVDYLYNYFGEQNILENERAQQGKIMFNTRGESGFSLRVYSIVSKVNKSLSIMNRSGGRPIINFPSKAKLIKYLPNKTSGVNNYLNIISSLGAAEILNIGEKQFAHLPLKTVEDNAGKFCEVISLLI